MKIITFVLCMLFLFMYTAALTYGFIKYLRTKSRENMNNRIRSNKY